MRVCACPRVSVYKTAKYRICGRFRERKEKQYGSICLSRMKKDTGQYVSHISKNLRANVSLTHAKRYGSVCLPHIHNRDTILHNRHTMLHNRDTMHMHDRDQIRVNMFLTHGKRYGSICLPHIHHRDTILHMRDAMLHNSDMMYKGWQKCTGCRRSQVMFRKRATNHRALVRKMTYRDKASYVSSKLCIHNRDTICLPLIHDRDTMLHKRHTMLHNSDTMYIHDRDQICLPHIHDRDKMLIRIRYGSICL